MKFNESITGRGTWPSRAQAWVVRPRGVKSSIVVTDQERNDFRPTLLRRLARDYSGPEQRPLGAIERSLARARHIKVFSVPAASPTRTVDRIRVVSMKFLGNFFLNQNRIKHTV